MKVKDLIKKLQEQDSEAEVSFYHWEYVGGDDELKEIENLKVHKFFNESIGIAEEDIIDSMIKDENDFLEAMTRPRNSYFAS